MVWLKGCDLVKPEIGNLREDLAFARDAIRHDAIKGGNAVRGHEQQTVTQIKHFADLAAFKFADAGQIKLEKWLVQHTGNMRLRPQTSKFKVRIQL